MYEYFVGQITRIETGYIVLETNGIGYKLLVANPYAFTENQQVKVYVYQAISDSAQLLYGFVDLDEKQVFELLIGVTGIGPKSALAILAASNHDGLIGAIQQENVRYLTKFPGVGKKTAQQIIIDLRDKVTKLGLSSTATLPVSDEIELLPPEAKGNQSLKDALAALGALGFSRRDVAKIVTQLEAFEAQSTDAYLREGLRLLTK
ncbi:holliday junction DNA helicase RuvA [Agrilactobacillus composti DSM 18527 = JCM 14202]|uniref:Holliday junction branch migration complex subunit RuvA n=1 Tax=Agrilactobacillus composti DSM 18527 = JCM 14202 TaxID=1423734 RepID=X0PRU2_9LACO|nr:Holliday junction branch migration protein RuvA [Agrilactobacillus composti]KRM32472.1 holliday junction DNA helicase RuvA [Agrilactobacillus composti DSM 18527 = JCM 14202]GAF39901.1 Holliday junction DNA helicase RuvA [Agrilactobacillus composti DSM 18527 = JCM 14202]